MPKLLIALIACFQVILCVNYFAFNQGSVMSFAMWQAIVCIATLAVIFNWKKLQGIKPE